MSFLDNVKANKPGIGGGVNPFATGGAALNNKTADNPFAPKTTTTPTKPATAPVFNPATGVGTQNMPKPGAPIGAPGVPRSPGMASPKAPTMPKPGAPAPTAPKAEEKAEVKNETKEVSTEEIIQDIKDTKITVPQEKVNTETKTDDKKEEPKTTATKKEETKTVNKPKSNSRSRNSKSKTTAKKEETKETTENIVDSPEEAAVVENLFKMPNTTIKYSEAVQAVKSKFVDEEWEDFRAEAIKESDEIIIEQDMQEGAVKKTIARLNTLREKIWVSFVDTKSLFESLSSKEVEGVIERVKFASLEGSNETSRKKAGILAVMNYETPEGETINLYELYDETRSRFYFLKSLMDTIQYKSNVLITMQSAIKVQKNQINNQ